MPAMKYQSPPPQPGVGPVASAVPLQRGAHPRLCGRRSAPAKPQRARSHRGAASGSPPSAQAEAGCCERVSRSHTLQVVCDWPRRDYSQGYGAARSMPHEGLHEACGFPGSAANRCSVPRGRSSQPIQGVASSRGRPAEVGEGSPCHPAPWNGGRIRAMVIQAYRWPMQRLP